MRQRFIRSTLTPARRRYLEKLADGQARKITERGRVGYDCRQLGWCSFAVRDLSTGAIIPRPDGPWWVGDVRLYDFLTAPWDGAEIITPEGLRMLEP